MMKAVCGALQSAGAGNAVARMVITACVDQFKGQCFVFVVVSHI